MNNCSNCGNPIDVDSKFCIKCGQSVERSISQQMQNNIPLAPQQASKPARSKKGIVVVGVVILVAVIAAVLLMGSILGGSTNGHPVGAIYDGSYLRYSAVQTSGGYVSTGNLTFTFDNVTTSSYSTHSSIVFDNQNPLSNNYYDYNNVYIINGDWTKTFVFISTSGAPTLIGQEKLNTNYGEKTTNHYSGVNGGGTLEFWEDVSNQMLYQIQYTDSNGVDVYKLTNTNMM